MKKSRILAVIVLLITLSATNALAANSYQVKTFHVYKVNGVELEAGLHYKFKFHPTMSRVTIFDRGQPLVSANVKVEPLGDDPAHTAVVGSDRQLIEYRCSDKKIIFQN